jgi:hypothetical protein
MDPVEKPLHVRVAERIKAKVAERPDGCWEWTGFRDRKGYGRFSLGNRPTVVARASYEAFIGPIPEGLTIDHLCRFPPCVNPAHLAVVTRAENTMRGETVTAKNAQARACPKGHAYDEANTYVDKRGRRSCKACREAWKRSEEGRAYGRERMRAARAKHPPTEAQRAAKREYDRRRYELGVRRG